MLLASWWLFFLIKGIYPWIESCFLHICTEPTPFYRSRLQISLASSKALWNASAHFKSLQTLCSFCLREVLESEFGTLQFLRTIRSWDSFATSLMHIRVFCFLDPGSPRKGTMSLRNLPLFCRSLVFLLKLNFFFGIWLGIFFSRHWISWNIMQRCHSCTKYVPDIPDIYWLLNVNAARQEPNTTGFRRNQKQCASPVCMWVTHALPILNSQTSVQNFQWVFWLNAAILFNVFSFWFNTITFLVLLFVRKLHFEAFVDRKVVL